jgi:hypothetical protein
VQHGTVACIPEAAEVIYAIGALIAPSDQEAIIKEHSGTRAQRPNQRISCHRLWHGEVWWTFAFLSVVLHGFLFILSDLSDKMIEV